MKSILVTTEHRGVWYAEVEESTDLSQSTLKDLKNCRMAIYWGTTKGLHQLAETGPTNNSKISAPCDILVLHKVTGVFAVTDEAKAKWNKSNS
ncbi:hypothetical protein DYU11_11720 [Fibrisoma montanum]|uniref:DUF6948 domain-containing protein n=1 Tax=Fibrisoma montanum TaxID=2305895 RepID=A0A418MB88_9BACT|nr:hypothetical protein [Fibrisoma montanum]RIV23642.1 hypothetical protein DYU11_11720 [Fibrisoma montanum]